MFCACSLLDATKLVGTFSFASLTQSPATHAQRAILFRCVRQQTCCKMVPSLCPVSLVLSTKGVCVCGPLLGPLAGACTFHVRLFDVLTTLFTVTMKRSDQNFTLRMKNPHMERHVT